MELADQQALENQPPVADAIVETVDNTPAEKPRTLREEITAAVKATEQPAPRAEDGKFAPKDKPAPEVAAAEVPKTEQDAPAEVSNAAAPPPGWSKESKELFRTLPASIQADVAKREKEVSDGFKKYGDIAKRHEEIEQVIAPRRAAFQQHGIQSDAQAISRLMEWESAVRSNPVQGIASLAKAYGVDLSQFARSPDQPAEQEQIPAHLKPVLDQFGNVAQTVQQLQQRLDQTDQQSIQREIAAFASDKPHFDAVRELMGKLMNSGAANTMDDAYKMALKVHPDVSALIQKEAQDKATEAEKKAAKERSQNAQRAGSSIKGSSPQGQVATPKAKPGSVRDTLKAAIAEAQRA